MTKRNLWLELGDCEKLVSDGATGTNLQSMGLQQGKTAEEWVLERPQAILDLEKQFVEAGSEFILTCTFGATRLRLEASGLGDRVVEINRQAVKLARQAIGERNIWLAGSIGPTGSMMQPLGPLSVEDARATFKEQAGLLAEAGVDMLVIETQFDLNEAKAAILGVRDVSNLPLVVSFSFDRGKRTMMGVSAKDLVDLGEEMDLSILGINCGRSLEDNLAVLKEVRNLTNKAVWFKPNAGLPHVNEEGQTVYAVTPSMMGQAASEWIKAGADIIGGCCGTSPQHLSKIHEATLKYR